MFPSAASLGNFKKLNCILGSCKVQMQWCICWSCQWRRQVDLLGLSHCVEYRAVNHQDQVSDDSGTSEWRGHFVTRPRYRNANLSQHLVAHHNIGIGIE